MNKNISSVNILGSEWKIKYVNLDTEEIDGLCHPYDKSIEIRKDNKMNAAGFEDLQKHALRHEIIHAFLFESGISFSFKSGFEFGHDETYIDWIAIQFNKIKEVYNILEI